MDGGIVDIPLFNLHCHVVSNSYRKRFPLIRAFQQQLPKKRKSVHERALRMAYSDHKTSFSELLKIHKSVTIHQKNLQYLITQIYAFFSFLKILSMNLEVVSICQPETHLQFSSVLNP